YSPGFRTGRLISRLADSVVARLITFLLNSYPVFEQFIDEFTRGFGVLVGHRNYYRFQTTKPLAFGSRQPPASPVELRFHPRCGSTKKRHRSLQATAEQPPDTQSTDIGITPVPEFQVWHPLAQGPQGDDQRGRWEACGIYGDLALRTEVSWATGLLDVGQKRILIFDRSNHLHP